MGFTGIVPFKKRAEYYEEADVGLNIAKPTLEDELSIRTRIFDYIWAGLPVVTCGRDEYSELVTSEGAGVTYESENPQDLVEKLSLLSMDRELFFSKERAV